MLIFCAHILTSKHMPYASSLVTRNIVLDFYAFVSADRLTGLLRFGIATITVGLVLAPRHCPASAMEDLEASMRYSRL